MSVPCTGNSYSLYFHRGFKGPDPFAPRLRPDHAFVNAILATTFFRCWHIMLFYAAWSTLITLLNERGANLVMQTTLLTAAGTVLGFVVSYRTTSAFERYNEGRRLWSQIIFASRNLSRTIWFHVPNNTPDKNQSEDEAIARSLIEKKSAINLIEAFSVAMKHYLRDEDGIDYTDLYYLVKYLPAYQLPAGIPSVAPDSKEVHQTSFIASATHNTQSAVPQIAVNGETVDVEKLAGTKQLTIDPRFLHPRANGADLPSPVSMRSPVSFTSMYKTSTRDSRQRAFSKEDENQLLPASIPPAYRTLDVFPFSFIVRYLPARGPQVKIKKTELHNVPLETTLYLSSYIAALQKRKICDVPTTNILLASLNQLVDSLTGLERILTNPIPFSYAAHIWIATMIYCLALPFQIYATLRWLTIPSTVLFTFIYVGFIVAGEEIQNPFGYDKNGLNVDHFTSKIIRNELKAVTSTPPPHPDHWVFVPENNLVFSNNIKDRATPDEWVKRGPVKIQQTLEEI